MTEAVKPIIKMLQSRMNNRIEASKAFEPNSLDQLPDSVKEMRELQAAQNRAVMQEQKDLIDILNAMYPDA